MTFSAIPRPRPDASSPALGVEGLAQSQPAALRLAIVANELFDPALGRMGGFGWAVRQVCRCFADAPELAVAPTIFMGERLAPTITPPTHVHGVPAVWREGSLRSQLAAVRGADPDLMLWMDFRPSYARFAAALPRVPIAVWSRDPLGLSDRQVIAGLVEPSRPGAVPEGSRRARTTGLAIINRAGRLARRQLVMTVTTPMFAEKLGEAYGLRRSEPRILPNIVVLPPGRPTKAPRPTVAVLGRLDPIKRPWLVFEIASRRPEWDFVLMGQEHFTRFSTSHAETLSNVRVIGHADDATKGRVLSSAWVLLNTSIHEGLAVSFLEALAYETPIVAAVDPEGIVSRFGAFAGRWPGDGLAAVPALEAALSSLLEDVDRRSALGRAGRAWVEESHSRNAFLRSFFDIAAALGLRAVPDGISA